MQPPELGELDAFRDTFAAAPASVAEELGLATLEIGGALCFAVPAMPGAREMNRVLGLGLREHATERHLDEIDAFFRPFGGSYWISLAPEARPADLPRRLAARGFAPDYAWAKFERPVEPAPEASTELRVERVGREHGPAFARVFARGYDLPEVLERWFAALPGRAGWECYLTFAGDEPAGCGAMFVTGTAGWLGIAATVPELRRRGSQGAILAARIRRAAELGCSVVTTETGESLPDRPGNSYRNIERAGFELRYVRPNWRSPTLAIDSR